MKKTLFILLASAFVLISCNAPKNTVQPLHLDESGNLSGIAQKEDFLKPPFVGWFEKNYNDYTANAQTVRKIKPLLDGVSIKAVMGTWCSDSRREVPHFYKILDMLRFNYGNLKLAAVSRDKEIPAALGRNIKIKRVPTFIFYRNGKEINRIVEYPVESLEADMYKILSGATYTNAYAE